MVVRTFVALMAIAAMSLLWAPRPALAQSTAVDRPAELRTGTCAAPGELVAPLMNLVVTLGNPQGQSTAMPVEQSGTIVPYSVADLLASNHIVTVQESTARPDVTVACGEIGGTRNPDGTLAVGMVGMNGSGLSGIAYFTPNPGFDNILITILLVGSGSTTTETVTSPEASSAGAVTTSGSGTTSEPVIVSEATTTDAVDVS